MQYVWLQNVASSDNIDIKTCYDNFDELMRFSETISDKRLFKIE